MDACGFANRPRPAATPRSALESLLAREYGLEGSVDQLGSERDETYRVRTTGKSFLVKVSDPTESFGSIDLQLAAITHLAHTTTLPVPTIYPTRGGRPTTSLAPAHTDQPPRTVHVMQFLAGSDVASRLLTVGQAQRVGEVHGELTRAFARFHHAQQDRRLLWDLKELPALAELVEDLKDRSHQRLARQVMHDFDHTVMPLLTEFDQQVVHGDYSVYNVLADPMEPEFVTGIIDFGDTHYGPVVFDVAIAVSNLLDHRLVDPWFLGARHVAGFLRQHPISPRHREALAVAAVARSLQRALISGWRAQSDPTRADYVLEHARDDWLNIEAALQTVGIARAELADPSWYENKTPSYGGSL